MIMWIIVRMWKSNKTGQREEVPEPGKDWFIMFFHEQDPPQRLLRGILSISQEAARSQTYHKSL